MSCLLYALKLKLKIFLFFSLLFYFVQSMTPPRASSLLYSFPSTLYSSVYILGISCSSRSIVCPLFSFISSITYITSSLISFSYSSLSFSFHFLIQNREPLSFLQLFVVIAIIPCHFVPSLSQLSCYSSL